MGFTVADIVRLIQDDYVLLENFVLFSDALEIPNSVVRPLLRQYNSDNLSVFELLAGILESWIAFQPSNEATLQNLSNKLNAGQFVNLADRVRALTNDLSSVIATRVEFSNSQAFSAKLSFNVKSAGDNFVGRELELRRLHDLMNTTSFRRPVLIRGIDGIEKTELVRAFVKMTQCKVATPPVIGIISCKSKALFKGSTNDWLRKLNQYTGTDNVSPQTIVRCLLAGLTEAVKKVGWIVVLEDVGSKNEVNFQELATNLLLNDAFVVMTTKDLDLSPGIKNDDMLLGQLTEIEVEELLRKLLKTPEGDIGIHSLSLVVPKIPVTVNMIVPFIKQKDFEMALHKNEKTGVDLFLQKLSEVDNDDRLALTLDALLNHIKLGSSPCETRGYFILEILALLDNNGLELHDLRKAVYKLEAVLEQHFLDSIELLNRFQLITVTNGWVCIVPIIRELLKNVLAHGNPNRECCILRSAMLQGIEIGQPVLHQLWNHCEKYPSLVKEFPEIPLQIIVGAYQHFAKERGRDFALPSIELLSVALGPNHEATLNLRRQLGQIYANMGEYDKALEVYKSLWLDMSATYGETWPQVVAIASEPATKFYDAKQYQNSLEWYLRLQQWDYDEKRIYKIADSYMGLERYAEAIKLLESFIAKEKPRQTEYNKYQVDNAKRNLLTCNIRHKEILKKVDQLRDLVTFRTQSLGPDNPATVDARCQLAEILTKVGETEGGLTQNIEETSRKEEKDGFSQNASPSATSGLCSGFGFCGSSRSKRK